MTHVKEGIVLCLIHNVFGVYTPNGIAAVNRNKRNVFAAP